MGIRIAHVITDLNIGGAEWMLYRLVQQDKGRNEHSVITLLDRGMLGEKLARQGLRVHSLDIDRKGPVPAFGELVKLLRAERPDAVQTWMYHANLLGGIAARAAGVRAVHWGIHNTDLDPTISKQRTIRINRACAMLSSIVPTSVVYCADSARDVHLRQGYSARNAVVVPNGFELPPPTDAGERARTRRDAGLPDDAILVGRSGRYAAQKDYETLSRAAAIASARDPRIRFVLWGVGVDERNDELMRWLHESGADRTVHLLGEQDDPLAMTRAMDIVVSSSRAAEAFPLVIGEAMSVGVPCVVTDVGDSGSLVGATGVVVPRRDPEALAAGVLRLAALAPEERAALGAAARERIERCFSLPEIAARYESVWGRLPRRSSA